jgi:hypothetical protein
MPESSRSASLPIWPIGRPDRNASDLASEAHDEPSDIKDNKAMAQTRGPRVDPSRFSLPFTISFSILPSRRV